MEEQIQQLANKTWKKFQTTDASKRYLIALAGIPGSGKTTTALSIAHHLNDLHHQAYHVKWPNSSIHRTASQPDVAIVVPLDGYHLTRAQLSAMPNAEEAHYRRGAAFTFDPESYLKLVLKLCKPIAADTRTIHAPSFDHHIKDPVENDIHIPPTARIIIIEGLYTALDRDIWRDAATHVDEIWHIKTSIPVATERVARRNFKAGLSPSYEAAVERTEANDMRNAREILAEMVTVDVVLESVEDEKWVRDEVGEKKDADEEEEEDEEKRRGSSDSSTMDDEETRPNLRGRLDSIAILAESGAGL